MNKPIDVVYTWVNASDLNWQNEFREYQNYSSSNYAKHPSRFRDNGELKYSLLSLEKFAPWVNRIFIIKKAYQFPSITHLTEETQNKISWVDEINLKPPALSLDKFYPTFNSLAIEANLHRITDLSERFIYFNNDMFLGKACEPSFFFPQDLARVSIRQNYLLNNNLTLFFLKLFSTKHPRHIINAFNLFQQNIGELPPLGLPFYRLPLHQCSPLLKSSYDWLWAQENIAESLLETSSAKFRKASNIHTVFLSSLVNLWLKKASLFKENDIKIYLHHSNMQKKLSRLAKLKPTRFCVNDSLANKNEILARDSLEDFLERYFC
ncbi:MAG: Stealth CR1 domain-containing protein [Proteobacteria bacterium]|nr:Stealth CR1 domain-containing protein [Pseudomonadota bacterium]